MNIYLSFSGISAIKVAFFRNRTGQQQLLRPIISNMAQGKSVALMSTDAEITTQQAAEILNVSRPHVIKLLKKGNIPYKNLVTHRRILLQGMLGYKLPQAKIFLYHYSAFCIFASLTLAKQIPAFSHPLIQTASKIGQPLGLVQSYWPFPRKRR
jgi:excisionase family DNA binding protein